jgi:hypothetical protein
MEACTITLAKESKVFDLKESNRHANATTPLQQQSKQQAAAWQRRQLPRRRSCALGAARASREGRGGR